MNIKSIFSFFIRLFAAFLLSKLVLASLGAETPIRLLGAALVLVMGSYIWELYGTKIGWVISRFLIGMNQLSPPSKKTPPKEPSD